MLDPLSGRWWKFDVVRALVAEQPRRPLLWTDDDLRGRRDELLWLRRNAICLAIAPPEHLGLTPRLLRAAVEWLEYDWSTSEV